MHLSNRPLEGLKVKRCMMDLSRMSGFFQGGKCREFSTPLHAYPSRLGQGLPDEPVCPVGSSFPRVFGAEEPATRCFLAFRRSTSRLKDRIEFLRFDLLLCASGQCRKYFSVRLRRRKSSLTGASAGANQRSSDKRQVIDSITWICIFGRPWTNSTRSSTP